MYENLSSFKDRLIEEIEYHGISKTDFAERVGISLGTLNMYLYRNSIPSADIAVKLAHVLNTTVEYLVTGRANSHSQSSDWRKQEINTILNNMNEKQLSSFLEITRAYKNSHS